MGLPKVKIAFEHKAKNLLKRSGRGVVLLLANTDKTTGKMKFKFNDVLKATTLSSSDTTQLDGTENKVIELFEAGANKVIVELVNTVNTLDKVLENNANENIDYLCYLGAETSDNTEIVNFVKAQRAVDSKIKAVLFNTEADHEGIINFATEKVTLTNGVEVDGSDVVHIITGALAGLELTRSSTYLVFNQFADCSMVGTMDDAIDEGKLILMNDGEKVKIARGVNSLTTIRDGQKKDFKKIKIIESMDIIKSDIKKIFEDNFIGKVANTLDNKNMFLNTINLIYFKSLEGNILSRDFNNKVEIDVEAIRQLIVDKGGDVSDMDETALKKYNTGSSLFIKGNVEILDSTEDLTLNFNV